MNPATLPHGTTGAIVTPARHYPTGAAMPLARRLALLDWARQNDAMIVEDDYDSEFRYQGQPLPSLCGLDGVQNTIYLGSFSKLLSAALRLGYLVLPEAIVPDARDALAGRGARASLVAQPALADFMDSGDFATHLRRMRRTYARRQAVLLEALKDAELWLDIAPDPSGMHLCCPLRPALRQRVTDTTIVELARQDGLNLLALSAHCHLPDPPQALLLGYAGFEENALRDAGQKLCKLLGTL